LRRLEWNGRIASALRAGDVRFNSPPPFAAQFLGLALLAVFRDVCESLFLEELLLSRREHKRRATAYTQNISVSEHAAFLRTRELREGCTGAAALLGKLILR